MFNSGFKIYKRVIIILLEGGIQGTSWQLCNSGKLSWWGSSVHNRCAKQSRPGSTCWGSEAAEQYKLLQRWSWSIGPPDRQTPAKENRGPSIIQNSYYLLSRNSYAPSQTSEWCNPLSKTLVRRLSRKPHRSPWGSWNKAIGPARLCKPEFL